MACSSCGGARASVTRTANRNTGIQRTGNSASVSSPNVVDSQSVARVQTAVKSNPNSPVRTKV